MDANGNDNRDSRRKFLTHGATLLAAGVALPALPALAGTLRGDGATASANARQHTTPQRLNAHGAYGSAALADLRNAVSAMMALPPEDPRNWYRQAMIHVLDCPHGNAWFLPWHRGYLHWFERIARKLINKPSFALPYWDWTSSQDMPMAFFQRDLLDTRSPAYIRDFRTFDTMYRGAMERFWGTLSTRQRDQLELRGWNTFEQFWARVNVLLSLPIDRTLTATKPGLSGTALAAVSVESVTNALAPSLFEDFGGEVTSQHSDMTRAPGMLESQPHNLVHGAIGGYMGDFLSSSDPVFWLHHANVDRLWSGWSERPGVTLAPESAAWRDEPFLFFCDENGRGVNGLAGDYISNVELGYGFETSRPIAAALSRPVSAAWPAMMPCQLQSTDLAINRTIVATVEPGLAACDAFRKKYQTAILIDMDRPQDEGAWHFQVEVKVEGASEYTYKLCGHTGFFGSMGTMPGGMLHRGQLKIGIAAGLRQCLEEAGPGALKFSVSISAVRAGSRTPTGNLKVYGVTLVSV